MLPQRWFKIHIIKSSTVVNFFHSLLEIGYQKRVFLEEQHAQKQEQGKELTAQSSRQAYVWNVAENRVLECTDPK